MDMKLVVYAIRHSSFDDVAGLQGGARMHLRHLFAVVRISC